MAAAFVALWVLPGVAFRSLLMAGAGAAAALVLQLIHGSHRRVPLVRRLRVRKMGV
jgi:hypothetical protein